MIGTENLEEKLSQVLNDPNSMAQLMSFAQSLGMGLILKGLTQSLPLVKARLST